MAKTRRVDAIGGLVLILMVATSTFAAARPMLPSIPGVTVEATATRVQWLGLIPSTTVRFEMAIYVDSSVRSFSAVHYECFFVDAEGGQVRLVSRGIAAREAFTTTENGRLVARTHEELTDREPAAARCRATKLEK